MFCRLSTDSPRSSTTSASVRWMSARFGGADGHVVASAMELESVPLGGFAAEMSTGMNWAKVTV